MLSRDRSKPPDTWNLSGTQGNVSSNPRHMLGSSQMSYQGILHSTNQSAIGGIPVERSTGRPVVRSEERIGSTIPMPMFAGRPSTMNSSLPAEIPQNSVADQQRLQVSSCSDFPSEAMLWIKEVEMVDSVDDLKSSRSIKCKNFPNFEMLDARIASALNKIIQNSYLKKKVCLDKQKAQKEYRFLRGRQIANMIYAYFRVIGAHDTVLDNADLFSITRRCFKTSIRDGTKFCYR